MSERTDALIDELARGLRPVRRLPGLGRVALGIAGLAAALAGAQLVVASFTRSPWPKPSFAAADAATIAAHALLATGALAVALGACVPGRERLARAGGLAVALAFGAVVWIGCVRFAAWPGVAALAPGWSRATLACALGSIVPAVLPVFLFARFGARAAPHRVSLALFFGAVAPLGLLTLPGILGCAYPDELHHVVGHLLTPALGALGLLLVALPVFASARASQRP